MKVWLFFFRWVFDCLLVWFCGFAAIERLKEEVMQCGEMEDRPVIAEFVPLKKSSNSDEHGGVVSGKENSDMKSWMSSAQLWSSSNNFDYSKSELKSVSSDFL